MSDETNESLPPRPAPRLTVIQDQSNAESPAEDKTPGTYAALSVPYTETLEARAARLRADAVGKISHVVDVMNRARAEGLQLDFSVQRDQFGRAFLQGVYIAKHL